MIRVTCPTTIFGPVVKIFEDQKSALEYITLCMDNKILCEVETLK